MFHEQRLTVPETPAELRAEYQDDFERALEDAGASDTDASDAAAATDLERERLDAVLAGDEPNSHSRRQPRFRPWQTVRLMPRHS